MKLISVVLLSLVSFDAVTAELGPYIESLQMFTGESFKYVIFTSKDKNKVLANGEFKDFKAPEFKSELEDAVAFYRNEHKINVAITEVDDKGCEHGYYESDTLGYNVFESRNKGDSGCYSVLTLKVLGKIPTGKAEKTKKIAVKKAKSKLARVAPPRFEPGEAERERLQQVLNANSSNLDQVEGAANSYLEASKPPQARPPRGQGSR
jgi:hypothetical protein